MLSLFASDRFVLQTEFNVDVTQIRATISSVLNIPSDDFYLLQNGRILTDATPPLSRHGIHVVPRILGGKGGFGSMLRAIGAQIEKTTNREACRDLSGRRLRDINEEKRLKNWIAQQTEREKEIEERKRKKIEKLCREPKHEFRDENYDKERAELPERLEDAVAQGLEASSSGRAPQKRMHGPETAKNAKKKKKPNKLWVDADVEDDLSSSEVSEDNEGGASSGGDADDKSEAAPSSKDDLEHVGKELIQQ